jgi:hypothetical protein
MQYLQIQNAHLWKAGGRYMQFPIGFKGLRNPFEASSTGDYITAIIGYKLKQCRAENLSMLRFLQLS